MGKMEFTNIVDAIRQGTPEDVMSFVEQKKVDVNIKNASGDSPLHIAALCGKDEVVKYLISKGADVNAKSKNGDTPLHTVTSAEAAKILISAGADVNAKNRDRGFTPLHSLAAFPRGKYLDTAKALVEGGADVNAKGNIGDSPLIPAITNLMVGSRVELVKFLVSNGADINTRDKDDWTPLHWAVNGDVETAKCLVALGANVNSRNDEGNTPLAMAWGMRKTAIAEYLSSICTPSPPSIASNPTQQNQTPSSGGCYIATAVYNSYDAPEVLCLRRFRDETLSASIFGRLFIRIYYRFSPTIAEKLKKTRHINMFVRSVLDKVVVRLNKKFHNQK
jgi:ankyrin repeat protein